MSEKFDKLRSLLGEITALQQAGAVLGWDRETYMPAGGGKDRANQMSTLARLIHDRAASDELGQLLEDLESEVAGMDPDSDEARIIRVTKRDYDRNCKIPGQLVQDISRASSEGIQAWRQARASKDYCIFAPAMKRNTALNVELAQALGAGDGKSAYDALLDQFEPGLTSAQLEQIFSELRGTILPLVQAIANSPRQADQSMVRQHFDETEQIRFGISLVQRFGYDANRGRLDKSPHPFCTSFGIGDVRITTRVYPDFLNMALFATMHESGHAMYEQGISPSLSGTPVAHGASGGVHESQSRLWENLVGRSRPFQDFLVPRLREAFPSQLGDTSPDAFYRVANYVRPSLNRVTSDEVNYNLHILLRYELENELLAGTVDTSDLAAIWVERSRTYFGLEPAADVEGVLQDIHWSSAGEFGVFPSYTLGNVIGAQLFRQAHKDMPDLDEKISKGEFSSLLGWLQTNLYQHGRKFEPNEIVERITGEPINTKAWIDYVTTKYSELYAL